MIRCWGVGSISFVCCPTMGMLLPFLSRKHTSVETDCTKNKCRTVAEQQRQRHRCLCTCLFIVHFLFFDKFCNYICLGCVRLSSGQLGSFWVFRLFVMLDVVLSIIGWSTNDILHLGGGYSVVQCSFLGWCAFCDGSAHFATTLRIFRSHCARTMAMFFLRLHFAMQRPWHVAVGFWALWYIVCVF